MLGDGASDPWMYLLTAEGDTPMSSATSFPVYPSARTISTIRLRNVGGRIPNASQIVFLDILDHLLDNTNSLFTFIVLKDTSQVVQFFSKP